MIQLLKKTGLNQDLLYVLGFASVAASIAIWNAKKGDDDAHAERFGIFVGLWAPTFFAIANGLAQDRLTSRTER
ncbi:MAG: hypothetical protein WEB78_09810 [Ilumatobacteraceae bacterium]